MLNIKKITIIGGGNIGTQVACTCASKGYDVTVYSSKPHRFSKELQIVDAADTVLCRGTVNTVTDDIKTAMDADLVFITHPANLFPALSEKIAPFIKKGVLLGCLPGTGGAEFSFKKCIDKGAVLFGFQRVPAVARLVEYGKKVRVEGKRDALHIASIPSSLAPCLSEFTAALFDMPCVTLPNYFCVTMTPSNPILHTTRLATMFEDYKKGKVYPKNPLFYGEWSDASSKRLLDCDAEHQHILAALPQLDLSSVKSLVLHYDNSNTPEKMSAKLRSIQSLHNIASPMVAVDGGFIPDFSSRYFTADFPFGLAIIKEIAEIVGVDTPEINKTLQWYKAASGDTSAFDVRQYGLHTVEDIYRLYR